MPGVEELADELYALPPGQFIDARAAVVGAARAAGEKSTAAALAKLRKPTVTAWLANRIVRTQPDLVAGALALGPALREATIAGDRDALRDLTRHRRALLGDLIAAARTIAQETDHTFSASTQRELEATFTAAATDPTAAATLAAGRLTVPLSSSGLGFELGGIPPERATDRPAPAPRHDPALPAGQAGRSVGTQSPSAGSASPPAEPTQEGTTRRKVEAREQRITDADQALAAARLQDADAAAALGEAQAALEAATAAEEAAAAAHQAARAAVSDARADLTAAKADAASTRRAVALALAELEKARTT